MCKGFLNTSYKFRILFLCNAKACIDRGMQMDMDDGIAIENELFAMCFATADQKEGMGAFLEKRPANFQNG